MERLKDIISDLRKSMEGVAFLDRAVLALMELIHIRLARMRKRLTLLIWHWRAGTLPKPRKSRAGQPKRPDAKPRPKLPSIPGRAGYLVRHVGNSAVWHVQELRKFLASEPEFLAFLAACPQAGRLLRPLCHMLAIDLPEQLKLAPKPRKPRPKRPPREKPEPYRIPIPPGARAWMPKKPRRRRSTAP